MQKEWFHSAKIEIRVPRKGTVVFAGPGTVFISISAILGFFYLTTTAMT